LTPQIHAPGELSLALAPTRLATSSDREVLRTIELL